MSFSLIKHQQQAVAALQGAIRTNRMPHGFIFCGPAGVGKALTASALARYLLCEQPVQTKDGLADSCGACKQCVMADHGTHPDLSMFAKPAEAAQFPINLVTRREGSPESPTINESVQLKPMQAARRVTIIEDAESMTEAAANAFLKTFEEAPDGSFLILLVTSLDRLLPTIRSRGRLIRFRTLPVEFVAELLIDQGLPSDKAGGQPVAEAGAGRGRKTARSGTATATAKASKDAPLPTKPVSPEEAEVLANWSDGSIAQARSLASCNFAELREKIFRILPTLDRLAALEMAETIDSWVATQAEEQARTKAAVEKNSLRRRYLKLALALLASVFRDSLVLVHAGPQSLLTNIDAEPLLEEVARSLPSTELEAIIARLLECQTLVDRNAHIQLLLENACLDVADTMQRIDL